VQISTYRALHNCLESRLQSCTDKRTGALPPTHCPQVQPRNQSMASQRNIYSLFWIWKITISDIQNKCLFWISEIIISYIRNTFLEIQKSFWWPHACAISCDICAQLYYEMVTSVIDIAVSLNQYDHCVNVGLITYCAVRSSFSLSCCHLVQLKLAVCGSTS